MYSTTTIIKNSKHSGKIIGTHQKIDKIARRILKGHIRRQQFFPKIKEILYFEGTNGPDGIKRKSPGQDEPMHFIQPAADNGKLIGMILDHQYNLKRALKEQDHVRASFEAAWMAHAIADGLTPAHHFPYEESVSELKVTKEPVRILNIPIKGIMRGHSLLETLRNNWLYLGPDGYMTEHMGFELGVAIIAASSRERTISPKLTAADFEKIDLEKEFYRALARVHKLDMYTTFREEGWTAELALEAKEILLPEVIRVITLAWASCLPPVEPSKPAKPAKRKKSR